MPIRRADDNSYSLAVSASATGSSIAIKGGEYMFFVEGTAGGSTLSLQIISPNGTWVDVQVFTGAIVKFTTLPGNQTGITLPAGYVRLAVTGGAGVSVTASLVGLG